MLQIFDSLAQLNMFELLQVYEESNLRQGTADAPQVSKWEQLRIGETYMREYLMDFLKSPGTKIAVWSAEGVYASALRLEKYQDGYLVTGLETAPAARGKGYATKLLVQTAVLIGDKLYSHIMASNHASVSAHKKAGFHIVSDYARLLDGSVSRDYYTLSIH